MRPALENACVKERGTGTGTGTAQERGQSQSQGQSKRARERERQRDRERQRERDSRLGLMFLGLMPVLLPLALGAASVPVPLRSALVLLRPPPATFLRALLLERLVAQCRDQQPGAVLAPQQPQRQRAIERWRLLRVAEPAQTAEQQQQKQQAHLPRQTVKCHGAGHAF